MRRWWPHLSPRVAGHRWSAISRGVSEALGIVESQSEVATFSKSVSESLGVVESHSERGTFSEQRVEALTVTAAQTGSVTAGSAPALAVSANGRYLTYNGSPFLINADTPWQLVGNCTNAQIDTYLNDRASRGFNAILIEAPTACFATQTPLYNNVDGQAPFSPTSYTSAAFQTLNNSYWTRVDYVVNQAKLKGIVVLMCPAYLGFGGGGGVSGDQGWNYQVNAATNANLQTYGATLANRYTQGNVIWVMGGDYDAPDVSKGWNIAVGIRSVRPTDIFTYHGARTTPAYANANGQPGFNLNNIYLNYDAVAYSLAATEYARPGPMPFFMVEGDYENDSNTNAAGIRRQFITTVLAGGCGHCFGENDLWGLGGYGSLYSTAAEALAGALNTTGANDMGRIGAFFQSYSWHLLQPKTDTSLVQSPALGSGASRITPARASDGTLAMVYTPSSASLTVVMSALTPSSVRARLWNPADGSYATVAGSPFANTGTQVIATGGERVLVLDADTSSTFAARAAGPSVMMWHDFSSDAEVNQFRWTGNSGSYSSGGQDPNSAGPGALYVTRVPFGGADGGSFLRVTYPLGSAGAAAGRGNSYWYRPLAPLTGATNGKGTDDPAASGTVAVQTITVTQGNDAVLRWTATASNAGYYGHPNDVAANPTKYHGTDFYLQVRVRRAVTPGSPPDAGDYSNICGKFVWPNVTTDTSTAQEIVTYGQAVSEGDAVGVQSRTWFYEGVKKSGGHPTSVGADNETDTISNGNVGWRYSGGWDTLLYHITPGLAGGTGTNRTRVEIWAQHDPTMYPAESGVYTKIWDVLYTGQYETGTNSSGSPRYPGFNAIILGAYHNGSAFLTTAFAFDYDQLIVSKATIPAPVATLPTWRQGQAVGEWRSITGTALSSANPSPIPPGTIGPTAKTDAWTSFAVDPTDSSVYTAANGGHHDYSGNEVDRLRLSDNAPQWLERVPPSSSVQLDVNWYNDGKPTSTHTYYGQVYEPFARRVLNMGGYRYDGGTWTDRVAGYDIASNAWLNQSTYPSAPSGLASGAAATPAFTVDHRNGNIYGIGNFVVYRLNRSNNTWEQRLTSGVPNCYYTASAFDTVRNRILIVGGDASNHHVYDVDANTITAVTLTGAQASAVQNCSGAGMVYVPAIDSYLLRTSGSGGTVLKINAWTWECTALTTSGGSSIPGIANGNGCFNKFLYVPALCGCVYVPQFSSNVWFLRIH